MADFTKRQWLTLIVIGIADFCNAICVSLQAPFYPQEAEKKGCSATEYGFVFGVFELVVFIISPIYGQHLNRIGAKVTFNAGIYTTGICAILFGLLDRVNGHTPFIVLSFTIRIIEALGNAAFLTASFAIIAKEFPNNVAVTFASLETCFGFGLIVGPTVGGALFQLGGYTLPFAVMGSALFASAVLTAFVLPKYEEGVDRETRQSMTRILKIPGVLLATCSIVVTSMSIGFLQATLEPHLRQFMLSPMILGVMFVINGGTYALTSTIFGWLCDSKIHPKYVTVVGCFFVAAGFCLIGPAPFIPYETTLWLTISGLVLHGLGMGSQLVASFSDALRTSVANGFPNSIETYGLVSGLWTSTFALGAFIGPSISGILYDSVGFRHASMFIVGVHILVGLTVMIFMLFQRSKPNYVELKDDKLPPSTDDSNARGKTMPSNITDSVKSLRSIVNGISIEQSRPPAMNSLIACNSYKSKAWPTRDLGSLTLGPYSRSYGTVDGERRENATSYLQGVA
ncbi:MFS-type transporter SLC18B1-like [Harmonia axyridis]|uniref:MFS-type transporter SLC18B1-like n=1 Tax=Harmonia axyridis TaxID=115357 RepID=UPI001E279C2C|nr:MFS-type transporter SLC18B1-like [Harmonia axyridis]